MTVISTQYRIRYAVPTNDGNKEIHTIICDDRYRLQIHINKIMTKKSEGYEFIGLDDRIFDPYNSANLNPNYGWNKIFDF